MLAAITPETLIDENKIYSTRLINFSEQNFLVKQLFNRVYPLQSTPSAKILLIESFTNNKTQELIAAIKIDYCSNKIKLFDLATNFTASINDKEIALMLLFLTLNKIQIKAQFSTIFWKGSKALIVKISNAFQLEIKDIVPKIYKLEFPEDFLWNVKKSFQQRKIEYFCISAI